MVHNNNITATEYVYHDHEHHSRSTGWGYQIFNISRTCVPLFTIHKHPSIPVQVQCQSGSGILAQATRF